MTEQENFEHELTSLLNRYSQENASNTPDFILAQYLLGSLAAWNTATQQRENWYGRDPRPTSMEPMAEPNRTDDDGLAGALHA